MNTPKAGQLVYVNYFGVDRSNTVFAKLKEKEFYRTSNPSWAKGDLRWVVGPIGKARHEGGNAPYGMAYKPEQVFETAERAKASLNEKIEAMITQLRKLQA